MARNGNGNELTNERQAFDPKALREALSAITHETRKPNHPITNEWYWETVAVVRGIAERALDGRV